VSRGDGQVLAHRQDALCLCPYEPRFSHICPDFLLLYKWALSGSPHLGDMAFPTKMPSLIRTASGQCGVGVAGATTLVPMGLQRLVDSLHERGLADWGILHVDFANAFNTLKRSALLEAVGRRCAVALPWMATCYQAHSALYCGQRVLES